MVELNGQFTGKEKTKVLRVHDGKTRQGSMCVLGKGRCFLIFDFKTDFSWRLHLGI